MSDPARPQLKRSVPCDRCKQYEDWTNTVDWEAEARTHETGLPAEVYRVLMSSYDWTYHTETGEIWGLTAGDQGYEPAGVFLGSHHATLLAHRAVLREALQEAIELIRTWHGMGDAPQYTDRMWELYQESPEMKRLTAALSSGEGRTEQEEEEETKDLGS